MEDEQPRLPEPPCEQALAKLHRVLDELEANKERSPAILAAIAGIRATLRRYEDDPRPNR